MLVFNMCGWVGVLSLSLFCLLNTSKLPVHSFGSSIIAITVLIVTLGEFNHLKVLLGLQVLVSRVQSLQESAARFSFHGKVLSYKLNLCIFFSLLDNLSLSMTD